MDSNALIPLGPPRRVYDDRLARLASELRHACRDIPASDLRDVSLDVVQDLGRSVSRRVMRVAALAATVARGASRESVAAWQAVREQRLAAHATGCRVRAGATITRWSTTAVESARAVRAAFDDDSSDASIHLLTFTLAALAGSAAVGSHDLSFDADLSFASAPPHSSLLAHSIVVGAALETMCLATVRLVELVHARLPDERDPFWDRVHARAAPLARTASQGLSAGIAWHLLVDGLGHAPAPPLGWSEAAWRAWLLTNAKVEAFDAFHKPDGRRPQSAFGASPTGGASSGPAEPDPRRQ